jgi:hypothetical protein
LLRALHEPVQATQAFSQFGQPLRIASDGQHHSSDSLVALLGQLVPSAQEGAANATGNDVVEAGLAFSKDMAAGKVYALILANGPSLYYRSLPQHIVGSYDVVLLGRPPTSGCPEFANIPLDSDHSKPEVASSLGAIS